MLPVKRDFLSLCTTAISCQFVYPDTSRPDDGMGRDSYEFSWRWHRRQCKCALSPLDTDTDLPKSFIHVIEDADLGAAIAGPVFATRIGLTAPLL
jgi:hypothetical protein